ncbi:MAG: helix-turn-helix domain-containing protein [Alphaproteobacteria bacterium]
MAGEILQHVDGEIGSRIRLRRAMLGLSQKQLGDAIGLTPQQVQKYEKGINRIAASTLFIVAEALNVPVSFFFDEMLKRRHEEHGAEGALLVDRRETLDLLRAYHKVADAKLRRQFIEFIREIARMSDAVRH